MFEIFEAHITAAELFTKDELMRIRALSTEKKLRRKQLLLREGEICRHKTFVAKGLLRTYGKRDDGTEYIMRFAPENTWMVDPVSFHNQTPSKYNIEALEDTELIQWSRESSDMLLETIPAFRSYSDKLKASSLEDSQNRLSINISATAEEKYQEFITAFPDVFRRVPLHMVASYLGVSRETLSRIRHARVRRQKEF